MTVFSPRAYHWLATFQREEIRTAALMSSDARCFAIQSAYRLSENLSKLSPGFDTQLFLTECGLAISTESEPTLPELFS